QQSQTVFRRHDDRAFQLGREVIGLLSRARNMRSIEATAVGDRAGERRELNRGHTESITVAGHMPSLLFPLFGQKSFAFASIVDPGLCAESEIFGVFHDASVTQHPP